MASGKESTIPEMDKLSLDNGDLIKAPGSGQWCVSNWGCPLPRAYELAYKFFKDQFSNAGADDKAALSAKLTALSLQIQLGTRAAVDPAQLQQAVASATAGASHSHTNPYLSQEVLVLWQTLGDQSREAAMEEFVQTMTATAEPALTAHVLASLGRRDSGAGETLSRSVQQPHEESACPSLQSGHTTRVVPALQLQAPDAGDAAEVPRDVTVADGSPNVAHAGNAVDEQREGAIQEGALWTLKEIKEFKEAVRKEAKQHDHASSVTKVGSGETLTVRVPTHRDGSNIMWEFATDSYDIAFGIYFEWNDTPPDDVQVVLSDSSDEDDENEFEAGAGGAGSTDPEKGSGRDKTDYGPPVDEIIPIFRRNCHEEVHCGSHVFPGTGVYLLKFDNSYSLWRSKTLYYRVYCA